MDVRDRVHNKRIPDEDTVFYDGFVYIIVHDYIKNEASCIVKILHAEYDDPVTLADIAKKYYRENVMLKVMYDDAMVGRVYRYNNYGDGQWDMIGETIGYA